MTTQTIEKAEVEAAPVCTNIGKKGRRFRALIGLTGLGIGIGVLAAGLVFDWSWWARALAGLPVAGGMTSYLQSRRGVCVAHARTGSREDDDMRVSRLPKELDDAIRAAAAGITRDGAIAGAVVALVGALSVFVR